jgi:hypothetical protein
MKKLGIYVLVLFSFIACQAQNNQDSKKENNIVKNQLPKGKWKVNKKYDKKGNLIQYDSVYTYSYQGKNFYNNIEIDSLMNQFKLNFKEDLEEPFNSLFFTPNENDLENSFFDQDYYLKNFKNKNYDINAMMQKMDSIRELFLKDFLLERNNNKRKNKENKL